MQSTTVQKRKVSIWAYLKKASLIIGIIGGLLGIYNKHLYPISSVKQLTIFVTDVNGNVVIENSGELNIPIGNRILNSKIGNNGRTIFTDISSISVDDTITIGLKAKGWEIANKQNKFIYKGKPIHIEIKKLSNQCMIKGSVKSRDGQYFLENVTIRINSDTITTTNHLGFFRINLLEHMCLQNTTNNYKLTVSKEGYKTKTYDYFPYTDAQIRLLKINN